MHIDARELDLKDLFIKLKEILASKLGCEVSIEVLVNTSDDAKRLTAFVSMSGCRTEIDKKDNYYIMQITGIPCCA
jgi:hypothetical protein